MEPFIAPTAFFPKPPTKNPPPRVWSNTEGVKAALTKESIKVLPAVHTQLVEEAKSKGAEPSKDSAATYK